MPPLLDPCSGPIYPFKFHLDGESEEGACLRMVIGIRWLVVCDCGKGLRACFATHRSEIEFHCDGEAFSSHILAGGLARPTQIPTHPHSQTHIYKNTHTSSPQKGLSYWLFNLMQPFTCTHIQTLYTHIQPCVHIHTHTHRHTYTQTASHAHSHIYTHPHTYTLIHTQTHIYTNTHTYTLKHRHTYTQKPTHKHSYTHSYTH